jgi:hypothetical protein
MSAAQAPDPARLDELRRRFEKAAYDFPSVEAVVVYQPDLRSEETERQARESLARMAHSEAVDPDLQSAEGLAESTKCAYEAARYAVELDEWIPPFNKPIDQLGGQLYWAHGVGEHVEDGAGRPAYRIIWRCTLFGPPAGIVDNPALHLFSALAHDAARLILRGNGKGNNPRSGWLIHLADRDEALRPDSRRRYLAWPTRSGVWMPPMWVPVSAANPKTSWWAARLPSVFQLSRDAVEQAIDQAARAPAPPAAPPAVEAPPPSAPVGAGRQQIDSKGPPAPPRRTLKEPPKEAIALYRYQVATGKKQTALANDPKLMEALGRQVSQGTISRWLSWVRKWIEAGNVLPPLPEPLNSQPTPLDPERIDLGKRQDGRTRRQRGRRISDNDN